MKRLFVLLLIFISSLVNATTYPHSNESFSKAKKDLLKKVYYDHKETFYCLNPYDIRTIQGKKKPLSLSISPNTLHATRTQRKVTLTLGLKALNGNT